jgi:hypothetical protein
VVEGARLESVCTCKGTEGSNPSLSATESAGAETSRAHLGAAPENPAIPRGFGRPAQMYPNRRRRVRSAKDDESRIRLCGQVGRFGFALDSPTDSRRIDPPTGSRSDTGWLEALPLLLLELFLLLFLRRKFGFVGLRLGFLVFAFRHALRVHRMSVPILLAPPFSLPVRRLLECSYVLPENFPRFRGFSNASERDRVVPGARPSTTAAAPGEEMSREAPCAICPKQKYTPPEIAPVGGRAATP